MIANQLRPKIDPWRSDLDELLAENDRQAKRQPKVTIVCGCSRFRKDVFDDLLRDIGTVRVSGL